MKPCTVMSDAYGATGGCLPHTGFPIWVVVAGALVLLALALGLRWLDRPR